MQELGAVRVATRRLRVQVSVRRDGRLLRSARRLVLVGAVPQRRHMLATIAQQFRLRLPLRLHGRILQHTRGRLPLRSVPEWRHLHTAEHKVKLLQMRELKTKSDNLNLICGDVVTYE